MRANLRIEIIDHDHIALQYSHALPLSEFGFGDDREAHRLLPLRFGTARGESTGLLRRSDFCFEWLNRDHRMHGGFQLADNVVLVFGQINTRDQAVSCGRWLDQQIGDFVAHLVGRLNQGQAAREHQAAQHERDNPIREVGDDAVHRNLNLERTIVERPAQQWQFIFLPTSLIVEFQCASGQIQE